MRESWDKKMYELIMNRDGATCIYCGSAENLALDHIVPIAVNGDSIASNLAVSCRSCNSSKGGKRLLNVFEKQVLDEVAARNEKSGIHPDTICVARDWWGYMLGPKTFSPIRVWSGENKSKYHEKKFNRKVLTYVTPAGAEIRGIMAAIDIFTMIHLYDAEYDPPLMKTIEEYIERRDNAFRMMCEHFGLEVYDRGVEEVCSACLIGSWFSIEHENADEERRHLAHGMNDFLNDYRYSSTKDREVMQEHLYKSIKELVIAVNDGKNVDMRY